MREHGAKACQEQLQYEVDMYQATRPLQGRVLPRLFAHGCVAACPTSNGTFMCPDDSVLACLNLPLTVRSTLRTRANDSLPFLAMERVCEGLPLDKAAAALPLEAVEAAVASAPAALDALHALGVAHNDVRGANVLVTPGGQLFIIDLSHASLGADIDAKDRDVAELGALLAQVKQHVLWRRHQQQQQ